MMHTTHVQLQTCRDKDDKMIVNTDDDFMVAGIQRICIQMNRKKEANEKQQSNKIK